MVHVVDAADAPLLWQCAEAVLINEDLFVLSPMHGSAMAVSSRGGSHIGHVSFDAVIQLATTLIEDVHVQNPPVVTEAITGPYSRVLVQGPLKERLEIFCGGVLEEGFGGLVDVGAESDRAMLASRSFLRVPVGRL